MLFPVVGLMCLFVGLQGVFFLVLFDHLLLVVVGLLCLFVGLLGIFFELFGTFWLYVVCGWGLDVFVCGASEIFLYFLALFDYMLFVVVACADPGRKWERQSPGGGRQPPSMATLVCLSTTNWINTFCNLDKNFWQFKEIYLAHHLFPGRRDIPTNVILIFELEAAFQWNMNSEIEPLITMERDRIHLSAYFNWIKHF